MGTPPPIESFLAGSLAQFLDRAAARAATPGGGSVAALTTGLAIAMGRMVAGYSRGRKAVAGQGARLDALDATLAELDAATRPLIDADARAYLAYREAVREAGSVHSAAVYEALRQAIAVPCEVMQHCLALCHALGAAQALLNPRLHSDLRVAAHLAAAAARSAAESVRVNCAGLPESDRTAALLPAESCLVEVERRATDILRACTGGA